jgi:mono/diheme cytochrome c family protein
VKGGAAAALAALCSSAALAAGNAENGERLHARCLQCHGTEVYLPPNRKVTSSAALRRETVRWADMYNPAFTRREIDDLVAYLERDFYRFPR